VRSVATINRTFERNVQISKQSQRSIAANNSKSSTRADLRYDRSMESITYPAAMIVLGLVAWFVFSTARLGNAKLAETGRMMVFAGLLGLSLAHARDAVPVATATIGR